LITKILIWNFHIKSIIKNLTIVIKLGTINLKYKHNSGVMIENKN